MSAALRAAGLALVIGYCLAPFLWQVITSLKPAADLMTLPPLVPARFTLEHYAAIFAGHSFVRVIANSALVAACTTLLALAVGAPAAFALAMLRVRGRSAILAGMLAVSMFPPIATVSPLYLALSTLGLHDTLAALIITYTTFSLPLAVWLLSNFFAALPRELYAAARVDGCTALGAFARVLLPLAAPGLLAAGLLTFIFAWNEFLFALTFTATDSARTIPVGIALFPGLHEVPYGEIAAAAVTVTLPVLALAALFRRRIVAGLTAGAVKG